MAEVAAKGEISNASAAVSPGNNALEKGAANLSDPPAALDARAAKLAASVSVRRRAPAPRRTLDFSTLQQTRFGLKGVFACFFFFNLAVLGGFYIADRRYKFSPFHHDKSWEPASITRRIVAERERLLAERDKALAEKRRQREDKNSSARM